MRYLYCSDPDEFKLHDLPFVVLQHVYSMLPTSDVLAVACVSKKLRRTSRVFLKCSKKISLVIPPGLCHEVLRQLTGYGCDVSFATGFIAELCNEDLDSGLNPSENIFEVLRLTSIRRLRITFNMQKDGYIKKIMIDFVEWINVIAGQVEVLAIDPAIMACVASVCLTCGHETVFPKLQRLKILKPELMRREDLVTLIHSSPNLKVFVCGGNVSALAAIPEGRQGLHGEYLDLLSVRDATTLSDANGLGNGKLELTKLSIGISAALPAHLFDSVLSIGRTLLAQNSSTLTTISLNHLAVWVLSRSTHVFTMNAVHTLDIYYDFSFPNVEVRSSVQHVPFDVLLPSLRTVKVFEDGDAARHLDSIDTEAPPSGFSDAVPSVKSLYLLCWVGTSGLRMLRRKFASVRAVAVVAMHEQITAALKIFKTVCELRVKISTRHELELAGAQILGISHMEVTTLMRKSPVSPGDYHFAPGRFSYGMKNGPERLSLYHTIALDPYIPVLAEWLQKRFRGIVLKHFRFHSYVGQDGR